MKCTIYRCTTKQDMYIYIAEQSKFDDVPESIRNTLGNTEFSMELELLKDTKLARENINTVISNLNKHGFHIQLPRHTSLDDLMAGISRKKLI